MHKIVHVEWHSLGLNNFKLEIRNSAMIAYASERKLCVRNFIDGRTMKQKFSVPIHQIYDISAFENFIQFGDGSQCKSKQCKNIAICQSRITDTHPLLELHELKNLTISHTMSWLYSCIKTKGCLFPNLYIPSLYLLLWQNLKKPLAIRDAASRIRERLFKSPYVSLHWRFEETRCPHEGHSIGLCLRTTFQGTRTMTLAELANATSRMCRRHATKQLFLATDGRLRGFSNRVDSFRSIMKQRFDITVKERQQATEHSTISLPRSTLDSEIDQQIMIESTCAIGSSKSTWFTEVALAISVRRNDTTAFQMAYETEQNSPPKRSYFPVREHLRQTSRLESQTFVFLDDIM